MAERDKRCVSNFRMAAFSCKCRQHAVKILLHSGAYVPFLSAARNNPHKSHTGTRHALAKRIHLKQRLLIHVLKGEHHGSHAVRFRQLHESLYPGTGLV